MKKYPRLYSLSTVGIRQHQEFDYLLHGFRTDFVGDSGCGKSMIADLIQLVFVGSETFASGTESLETREVGGMVLRTTTGKGTDMGYALLNIELQKGQFVVIGAYLESTSHRSRSFVIQMDHDETKLVALERAISVSDVIDDELIPTMEMLTTRLAESDFILHEFPQRKKFHSYLFKHKLLSIDLSQSEQILKDYSSIIQSFSRGKNLNIRDSSSLKRFLFGNEKAKEIIQKYRGAVEELKITLKEHAQNAEEIKIVTQKHEGLKELRDLKEGMESSREVFFIKQCAYAEQEMVAARGSLLENLQDYKEAKNSLETIQKIITKELNNSAEHLATLISQEAEAKQQYNETFDVHSRLEHFIRLRDTLGGTSDSDLIKIYKNYQEDKKNYQIISTVDATLKQHGVSHLFLEYIHLNTMGEILDGINEDLQDKEQTKIQKEQLLAFAKLNTEGSLGYWAIQNYQKHSLEVESVLMYFKDFPVFSPLKNKDKYIINPAELIKELGSLDKDADGFWLPLGEVGQYIPYAKNRLFQSSDIQEMKSLLATLSKDLKSEVEDLERCISKLKSLKGCIVSLGTLDQYLAISDRESKSLRFEVNLDLEISEEEFEAGCELLLNADQIQRDYNDADRNWKDKQRLLDSYNSTLATIKSAYRQIEVIIENGISKSFSDKAEELFTDHKFSSEVSEQSIAYLQGEYEKADIKGDWINKVIAENRTKLNAESLKELLEGYEQALEFLAYAFKEARLALCNDPDISGYADQNIMKPNDEENFYKLNKSLYESHFSEIVKQHAVGDSYRFETTQNYFELCQTLLPEAFLENSIESDDTIEVISEYLFKINDKNKSLNNRKLLKIRDILDEVGDEISKREDTVRQIHNFLDNGDREITGGHRVSLRVHKNSNFPKEWINDYIEKLSAENTLFATGTTLNELLNDSVSLDEKMIHAFHTFGGHHAMKPKVEDLLNPNSYFDLTFKMESQASGKINIGSTGQVYAAVALLCIARLSLVNKGSFNKQTPTSIRFMPIDEAEGLGSNFDLLYSIARDFDYQILTMAIKPLGKFKEGEQYIYMLNNNKAAAEDVNYQPFGVFCDADQQF